jgi:hypothetical protein
MNKIKTRNDNANLVDKEVTKEFINDRRKYYLSEFKLYDTDRFVTFNIVYIDAVKEKITVAVSDSGKISVCSFGLNEDENGFYFEYGVGYEKIALGEFEQIEED